MATIDDLHFVRCTMPETFLMVPRYLFEQIDSMTTEKVDALYQNGLSILMVPMVTSKGIEWVPNPLVHIFVLVDKEHFVKGILWAEADLVEKHIFTKALSLDKDYQSEGLKTEKRILEQLASIAERPELAKSGVQRKIVMATTRPKSYERLGFKRSMQILMEYDYGQNHQSKTKDDRLVRPSTQTR